MTIAGRTDALTWIERWDRQQERYVPRREDRFETMFLAVEQVVVAGRPAAQPRLLDLGCGPGAIGTRFLRRFRGATYLGLDVDPVLLHLAAAAGEPYGERFEVRTADLAADGWSDGLADGSFDVVASSTALHWLRPAELLAALRAANRVLRPGGLFVNADNLSYGSRVWQQVADDVNNAEEAAAGAQGTESWHAWWRAARGDAELGPLCELRDLRFPPSPVDAPDAPPPPADLYTESLAAAGFTDIETLWQRFDDRVIAGLKPAAGA